MKLIGLDVGSKRIGVAKADSTVRIAVPHGTISVDGSELEQIARLARVYGTDCFILGLPRNSKGEETQQSQYVRNFAKNLKHFLPSAKIAFQDESLTSVEAEKRLSTRKNGYKKGDIDAEAAAIILQDFLEHFDEKAQKSLKKTTKPMKKARKTKKKLKKAQKWSILAAILLVLCGFGLWYWRSGNFWKATASIRCDWFHDQDACNFLHPADPLEVFRLTFIPGATLKDAKKVLQTAGYSDADIDRAFNKKYDHPVFEGKPDSASLEGYIFGETYEFYKGDSVEKILATTFDQLYDFVIKNDLVAKFKSHGLSLYEGIVFASVIQGESKTADMPNIASVFYNRLARGQHLGSDATIKYYIDLIDPERKTYTNNYDILQVKSCYNTSEAHGNAGLPCGAVDNPGAAALLAVANPAKTSYLYFLTGDDGKMYYSTTAAGHEQNIRTYCKTRCSISL